MDDRTDPAPARKDQLPNMVLHRRMSFLVSGERVFDFYFDKGSALVLEIAITNAPQSYVKIVGDAAAGVSYELRSVPLRKLLLY